MHDTQHHHARMFACSAEGWSTLNPLPICPSQFEVAMLEVGGWVLAAGGHGWLAGWLAGWLLHPTIRAG